MNGYMILVFIILQFSVFNVNSLMVCTLGQVTNGRTCDSCGVYNNSDTLTSTVFIYQYYETYYTFPDNNTLKLSISNKFTGTLINKYTVLTSADAFITEISHYYNDVLYTVPVKINENFPTWGSMFQVVVGVWELNNIIINSSELSVNSTGVIHQVSAARRHPSYDKATLRNNIALLLLNVGVEFNDNVQPACLPPVAANFEPPVSGFIFSWTVYDLYWFPFYYENKIDDKINFTFSNTGYVYSDRLCDLSAGGPGYYQTNSKDFISLWFVVGILTREIYNCDSASSFRGVLTSVSYYVDWIYSNWKIGCVQNV